MSEDPTNVHITNDELKAKEQKNRSRLQREKPYVYNKIIQYGEKVKRGESIALLQLHYDYKCNFQCEHCSADKFMVKTKKERQSDHRRVFTVADVKELSRQGDEMGLATIVVTGGEPMIYPDFDQVVEAIDPAKFWIGVDTNGWFVDLPKIRHLKSIGIDRIHISLDSADPKEHDANRHKPGSHAQALKAIDAAIEGDLPVMIQTVVWKERAKSQEFIDFLELAKARGIATYVSYAKPVGNWEGKFDILCGNEEMDYLAELEKSYNVFTHLSPGYGIDVGCTAVKRLISITKYGDVMPCSYTFCSLGNFFEEPLRDIVNRGLQVKHFAYGEKRTCLTGNKDNNFIQDYLVKMYGKRKHPIHYLEVFGEEDLIKP